MTQDKQSKDTLDDSRLSSTTRSVSSCQASSSSSVDSDEIPGCQWVEVFRSRLPRHVTGNTPTAPEEITPVNAYLVQESRMQELEEELLEERRFRQQIVQAEVIGIAQDCDSSAGISSVSFSLDTRMSSRSGSHHELDFANISLYGRDNHVKTLGEAFGKLLYGSDDQKKSLVMIGGSSGTGKTALANSLEVSTRDSDAIFVMGKFDLNDTNQPYNGVKDALDQLCHEVLCLDGKRSVACQADEESGIPLLPLGSLRMKLRENLASEIGLLSRIIPSLRTLVGANLFAGTDDSVGVSAASERLKYAFCRFMQIVTEYAPIVFVCDDLQWVDKASMDLIKAWLDDDAVSSLMIVGCYRDNEVDESHLLGALTKAIESETRERMSVHNLRTENLAKLHINEMLSELLSSSAVATEELAQIVTQRTLGNPFFVTQYLISLCQTNLLSYNTDSRRWAWDEQVIREKSFVTENVVEFLKNKLNESCAAQRILPLAACLGAQFTLKNLRLVVNGMKNDNAIAGFHWQPESFSRDIAECKKDGFIVDCDQWNLRFAHDKIQEASLSLIPDDGLKEMRHKAGTILFCNTNNTELEGILFIVTNLINASQKLLVSPMDVVKLNLRAAEKANGMSAFSSAATYVRSGILHLPDVPYGEYCNLSLDLNSLGAEVEIALGNSDTMEFYYHQVVSSKYKYTMFEQIRVQKVMIDHVGQTGERTHEALQMCLDVLDSLGCKFPKSISGRCVRTMTSFIKMNVPSVQHVNMMDMMSDPVKIESFNMLNKLGTLSYLTDSTLIFLLSVIKMVQWTLRYGLHDHSPSAFNGMGMIFYHFLNDHKTGAIYSELAISMKNRIQQLTYKKSGRLPSSQARSTFTTTVFLSYWIKPVQGYSNALQEGYQQGLRVGDTESALWCKHLHACLIFASGKRLPEIGTLCSEVVSQSRVLKRFEVAAYSQLLWQTVLNLIDPKEGGSHLSGSAMDEEFILKSCQSWQSKLSENIFGSFTILLCALYSDYEKGAELAMKRQNRILKENPGVITGQSDPFFRGLCLYAAASTTTSGSRRKWKSYLRHANKVRKMLRSWVDRGNPNVVHHLKLLDAEHEACTGNRDVAIVLYEVACTVAKTSGFIQDAALAHERLVEYLLQTDDLSQQRGDVEHHLTEAISCYHDWGASAKVAWLLDKYSDILPMNCTFSPSSLSSLTMTGVPAHVDLPISA